MIASVLRLLKRRLSFILLKGDNVQCPICQGRFKHFLPYGSTLRPNAQCPTCKSLERHRMIWLFLKERGLLSISHTRLLHVSPESVFYKHFSKAKNIDYVPIDKFDPGYRYPKGTLNVDITKIPFPDASFGAILCIHVLEHIPNDTTALKELHRVLKSDGWAIILVPIDNTLEVTFEDTSIIDPEARKKFYGQKDHVRLYGRDYLLRLQNAGFTVELIDYFKKLTETERQRFALLPGEDIYFCKR
jgi:SAM-dependent methyltransferase